MTQQPGEETPTTHLPSDRPLVLVTVGSDHHRFDRLVSWVDSWAASRSDEVDCLVQHGPADPPRHALGVDFMPHSELIRLMAGATAVVVQGGPMSIVETREAGRIPIAVPRLPQLHEVVDEHQVTFARRWAEEEMLVLAEDEASLHRALDDMLAAPDQGRVETDPEHERQMAEAVERVAHIAADLLNHAADAAPNVVMIGGVGRSGSTLLERCLAEVPGVAGVGEAVHLWERGLIEDQLCGCGAAFSACPAWTRVGQRAYQGWGRLDAQEAFADRARVVRNRHLVSLVVGGIRPEWRLRRVRLIRRVNLLYRAVNSVSRSRLIVDSSKHPAYAYLLRSASVQLRCVLVVRDPRGVAHSWSKLVRRPEVTGAESLMPQYSASKVAMDWISYRFILQGLRLLGVPVMVVHYEDFVQAPRKVVTEILRFSGVEPTVSDLAHLVDDQVRLGRHHTVAGNPMRFRTGHVPIQLDEAWRTELARGARWWVGALTAPVRWWDRARRPARSRHDIDPPLADGRSTPTRHPFHRAAHRYSWYIGTGRRHEDHTSHQHGTRSAENRRTVHDSSGAWCHSRFLHLGRQPGGQWLRRRPSTCERDPDEPLNS